MPAAQMPHIGKRRQRLCLEVDQPLGMLEQHCAGVGEHSPSARSIEKRLSDFIFESANDLTDCRLGAIERFRGV